MIITIAMKRSCLNRFFVSLFFFLLFQPAVADPSELIAKLKDLNNYIEEVKVNETVYKQALSWEQGKPEKVYLAIRETDKKGNLTVSGYEFYLVNLDVQALEVITRGKKTRLRLEIKNDRQFIKVFEGKQFTGYSEGADIMISDAATGRKMINLWKEAVRLQSLRFYQYSSSQEALDTLSVLTQANGNREPGLKQSVAYKGNDRYEITFLKTRLSGELEVNQYTVEACDLIASGPLITVKKMQLNLNIRTAKKYIQHYRNGVSQRYRDELNLVFSDVLDAQNAANALAYIINACNNPEGIQWQSSVEALKWIEEQPGTLSRVSNILKQAITIDTSNYYQLTYTKKKLDDRGQQYTETSEAYIPDLGEGLSFDVANDRIEVTLRVQDKMPYIKHIDEDGAVDFSSSMQIAVKTTDMARDLINALNYLRLNVNASLLSWAGTEQALNWVAANVQGPDEAFQQEVSFEPLDDYKISVVQQEQGKAFENYYLYLQDADPKGLAIDVSQNLLELTVPVRKEQPYIKQVSSDGGVQFRDELTLYFSSLLKARNTRNAIRAAVKNYTRPVYRWNSREEALAFLGENVRDIEQGKNTYKQRVKAEDECTLKLTTIEFNSRKSSEYIYTFNPRKVSFSASAIEAEGFLAPTRLNLKLAGKQEAAVFSFRKNGERKEPLQTISILVDDVQQGRKIKSALYYLSEGCE